MKKTSIIKFMLVIVVLIAFTSYGVFYYNNYNAAKITLMDAKNIQLAMRLMSIEYYGKNRNIYEGGTQYGMAEDTIQELMRLSGAEGEITLVTWNDKRSIPSKFYYQTEEFLVVYEYDVNSDELVWNIYQIKPVLSLKNE